MTEKMKKSFGNSSFGKSARSLSQTLSRRSNSKHGSERVNSVSSRVSTRFGFDAEDSETVKPARLAFKTYLKGDCAAENVAIQEALVVRLLKTSAGAAIARWARFKAIVSLGQGRFKCDLKKNGKNGAGVSWTFEVGLLKNIGYKRKGAKDFSLTFHNNDKVLNIVCESASKAEKWLVAIFAEIRVQANVFGIILRKQLNPTWRDVLRINKIDGLGLAEIDETPLTPEQEKELILDDNTMTVIETCLREEVDLWTLCRGKDHPDVLEAYERLAIWLKRNFRHQESKYWHDAAEKGRINHTYRMKHEMNPAENTMKAIEDSALDELRNPSGMKPLDKLSTQREQNSNVKMEERVAEVTERIEGGSVIEAGVEGGDADPFDELL